MKKTKKTKQIDDFKNDLLLNANGIIGGTSGKKGDIDRDKIGRPPTSGH